MQSITGSSSKGIPDRNSASGNNSISDSGKDVNKKHSITRKTLQQAWCCITCSYGCGWKRVSLWHDRRKNSASSLAPSSLRKLIASWNKKQRPIGAPISGAQRSAINNNSILDSGKDVNDRHSVEKKLVAGFIGFGDGAERKPWPVQDRSERIECFAEVH